MVTPVQLCLQARDGGDVKEEVHKRRGERLQDRELQEMSDEGKCLSMHQPWATLLVRGIKRLFTQSLCFIHIRNSFFYMTLLLICVRHEGRTWYSTHRGRLWIAATSKQATDEEIAEVERLHRFFNKGFLVITVIIQAV